MFLHLSVSHSVHRGGGRAWQGVVSGQGDVHGWGQGGVCGGGGHAWQGGMHGGGHAWQGTCMVGGMHVGGHAWQGVYMVGAGCVTGGMHGRGHAWAGCVCGRGACIPRRPLRHYEIRSVNVRAVRILQECILV